MKRRMPKTLGGLANKARAVQQERLALQKRVEELQAFQLALCEEIQRQARKAGLTQAKGTTGQVSFKPVPFARIDQEDKRALHDYVKTNDAFDLFEERLHQRAVQARWDEGLEVPGVVRETRIRYTISKVGKR